MSSGSTEPPTEPGLYQYRAPYASVIVFYEIERLLSGELVVTVDQSLEHMDLENMPGEWRGPILDASAWQ